MKRIMRIYRGNRELYLLLLPTLVFFIIFHYWPMYGAQIAFRKFIPVKGIWGSTWVGVQYFEKFFSSPYFFTVIRNTLKLSIYSLVMGMPFPILLALFLNIQNRNGFKRLVQTVSYAPHFISTVVMVSMIKLFTSPTNGMINTIIQSYGGSAVNFMGKAEWFPHLYVWTGIWQNMGWNSIVYLGALGCISPELHEAAKVDGASYIRRIWSIDLPGILPTIMMLLILSTGSLLSVGFEKVFLMQNTLNADSSEIISTYVYRTGILQGDYSYSTAVGLFNSMVNFIILVIVNTIVSRNSENSLF